MNQTNRDVWRFEPFELDSVNKELSRDGRRLKITPTAFRLLLYLVQHAGRLVKKEEILAHVWPGVTVGAGTIRYHVAKIRKVLGPDARYLSNIPREGYQLTAKVTRNLHPPRESGGIEGPAGLDIAEVDYYVLTAQNALRSSLSDQVIQSAQRGLELLNKIPPGTDHAQRELLLRSTLVIPQMRIGGYGDSGVEQNYRRIEELCQQLGDAVQPVPVLWGLWLFYHVQGRLAEAKKHAERCLLLAKRIQDPGLLAGSHAALGHTMSHLGAFAIAMEHLNDGVVQAQVRTLESYSHLHLIDPGVACYSQLAVNSVLQGRPDSALSNVAAAIERAHMVDPKESLGFALVYVAWVHQLRREPKEVRKHAASALELAQLHRLPQILLWATILAGWSAAQQADGTQAITQMSAGLKLQIDRGAQIARTVFLTFIADAYWVHHRLGEMRVAVDEALQFMKDRGERIYEAELHRFQGLGVLESSPTAAERHFRDSISIARTQGTRLFELRSRLALARLHKKLRKRKGATQALAALYQSFSEGLTTPDLREVHEFLSQR